MLNPPLRPGLPLTQAQLGIWLGQQRQPESTAYHVAERLDIDGPLRVDLFRAAVTATLEAAEALCCRFIETDGVPHQYPGSVPPRPLDIVDLSGDGDARSRLEADIAARLDRPFDLAAGHVCDHTLYRLDEEHHVWLQRAHHLALDGYGFSLIARGVAERYAAAAPAPAFGALAAVVEEDRAYLQSKACADDRRFWLHRLAGAPEPVSLAGTAAVVPERGRRAGGAVDPAVFGRLRRRAAELELDWPELLLALAAAWLARRRGAGELTLGVPVMLRLGSAAARVPCMAMNIAPLRLDTAAELSVADLARRCAAELRELRRHQRYRYERLKQELPEAGGPRRPFGTVVNIMPFDLPLRFGPCGTRAANVAAGPVEDLALVFQLRGAELDFDLDGHPRRYDAARLAGLRRAALAFFAEALAEPRRALGSWCASEPPRVALGEALRHAPRPVTALIAGHARHTPHARAVVDGGQVWSYAGLHRAALALAAQLRRLGLRRGDPVAVQAPRGARTVAALLGILYAGGAYLALDPTHPAARRTQVLKQARPALLLCDGVPDIELPPGVLHAALLPADEAGPERIPAAGDGELPPAAAPSGPEPFEPAAADPAYIVYTSGSTGEPKGVVIGHGALAHFAAAAAQRYGIGADDVVLQFAPLTFDASVEEIFVTLTAGGTLAIRDEAMLDSMPAFLDGCARLGVSVLDLPTAFWHELAYALHGQGLTLPPSLRSVIIGGEAALPDRVAQWRRAAPAAVRLFNTYGPSETTVVATSAELNGAATGGELDGAATGGGAGDAANGAVPIGRPLPGLGAVLLDEDGRPVEDAGVAGELWLFGPTLAEGYRDRPDLSAQRFAPLTALPGAPRGYRSGDRACYAADGQLVFLGRVDDEIKISGYRVAPGEVEAVLSRHPRVALTAVVGRADSAGRTRLVAYVVAHGPAPDAAELRDFVRERLPAPLTPALFRFVDALPRSSSGKIDRRRLAELDDGPPAAGAEPPAVDDPVLRTVLALWAEAIGCGTYAAPAGGAVFDPAGAPASGPAVASVAQPAAVPVSKAAVAAGLGPADDVFAAGAQSLQAIQVANRLSVELGRPVPVALLFRHPSAEALAAALRAGPDAGAGPAVTPAMLEDAAVPPEWFEHVCGPAPLPVDAPSAVVLLTGATGFVGAHLLDRLLRGTVARIVCAVRAASEAEALQRIDAALALHGLAPAPAGRIEALPADLTRPRFGLAPTAFGALADRVDQVLHCAAQISVVRDYQSLKAANVAATREIVRLAARRRLPVHHVSTLAIAPPLAVRPEVPECFVDAHRGLKDGYQQSKWLAEQCLRQAGGLGLPVAVYRLGRVTGARARPTVNGHDLFWRIIRAGLRVGALPDIPLEETWTPVDEVAALMVDLLRAGAARTPGEVFNVAHTGTVRLDEVVDVLRHGGYALERCPMPEWLARVAAGADDVDRGTLAFFETRAGVDPATMRFGPIASGRLRQRLPQAAGRPVDRDLLRAYVAQAVAAGVFPPPGGAPERRG